MFAAKDDEMVETFLLNHLHESFGECDHIRRSDWSSLRFDFSIFEGIHERLEVLFVVVEHQDLAFRATPVWGDSTNSAACRNIHGSSGLCREGEI